MGCREDVPTWREEASTEQFPEVIPLHDAFTRAADNLNNVQCPYCQRKSSKQRRGRCHCRNGTHFDCQREIGHRIVFVDPVQARLIYYLILKSK